MANSFTPKELSRQSIKKNVSQNDSRTTGKATSQAIFAHAFRNYPTLYFLLSSLYIMKTKEKMAWLCSSFPTSKIVLHIVSLLFMYAIDRIKESANLKYLADSFNIIIYL